MNACSNGLLVGRYAGWLTLRLVGWLLVVYVLVRWLVRCSIRPLLCYSVDETGWLLYVDWLAAWLLSIVAWLFRLAVYI